ncbi:hypothetical protein K8R04_02490 [Candidatus Uhrbacteria bacterium]|nr:hypothetical protein [Candidatus Uhrbacteria bacterium]
MRILRIAICITAIVFPLSVFAQTGPCGSGDACPVAGQICRGAAGSRLCYKTCTPAASGSATECSATETCETPSGLDRTVCVVAAGGASGSPSTGSEPPAEVPFVPITPVLGVPIPGGSLSAPTRDNGVVRVSFLAEYINAIYRYISSIALVIAIVMCVYGGFLYLGASAGIGQIARGKKIITDAIIGMLIILGAYSILNIINPQTVNLKTLELAFVQPMNDEDMESLEAELADPAIAAGTSGGGGDFITVDESAMERLDETCVHLNTPVDPSVIEPLRRAANRFCELRGSHSDWRIVGGGFRSPALSLRLWLKRCVGRINCTTGTGAPLRPGVTTHSATTPWSFSDPALRALIPPPQTAPYSDAQIQPLYDRLLPQAGAPSYSGHARGLAMDLYCGGVSRNQSDAFVPCQLLLEQAMKESGFCRIPNEWWHFELASNHPSRACNPSWTIGTASIPLGEGAAREVDYRSCTRFYSFSRARAGTEACH